MVLSGIGEPFKRALHTLGAKDHKEVKVYYIDPHGTIDPIVPWTTRLWGPRR